MSKNKRNKNPDSKRLGSLMDHLIWLCWAVGYSLSFPTFRYSFLIWFAFIPAFAYAFTRPLQKTVFYGLIYSIVVQLITIYWMFAFWEPGLPMLIVLYSVYTTMFLLFIAYIGKNMKKWRWVIVPALWISMEFLRSVGFHAFQWNLIGHTQWRNLPIIQSADLFGVWGIGFLILLVNSVLTEFWLSYSKKQSFLRIYYKHGFKIIFVLILFVLNLIYGAYQINHFNHLEDGLPKERLGLIQPNIGTHDPWWSQRWKHYGNIWFLIAQAKTQEPDLIVWSESMVRNYIWYYMENYESDHKVNLFNVRFIMMSHEMEVPMLMTSPVSVDKENNIDFNAAVYYDPEQPGDRSRMNAKIHLVPFGEWMPYYDRLPIVKRIMSVEGAGAYTPSDDFNVIQGRNSRFRVLICYEDIFEMLARLFIFEDVNYFINSTNDGWAYQWGFKTPHWQHLAASVITAVTLRRPIARAGNTACTGIVNMIGAFDGDTIDYQAGYHVGDISLAPVELRTFFVNIGFVFPFIVTVYALSALLFAVWKKEFQQK